jgi:uncharacterized protein
MDRLPDAFWLGVDQFNQRQFYACHDTLEPVWIEAESGDKNFYQGILQVAVALYHLGNHNWRGAVILMGEGANRLRGYAPTYGEIDVELLLDQTLELLHHLQQTGAEAVARVALQLGVGEHSTEGETSTEVEIADAPPPPQLPLIQRQSSGQPVTGDAQPS